MENRPYCMSAHCQSSSQTHMMFTAGTTYIFGEITANTDLLVYDYSEPYDTYNDSLAFGITTRKSSATLLRILSDNSNDYINITIKVSVDG